MVRNLKITKSLILITIKTIFDFKVANLNIFRVDDLYRFLTLWVPHLYGDLDEEVVACRGFELVESDTELWEEAETPPGDTGDKKLERHESEAGDLTRESWEVIFIVFFIYLKHSIV